MTAYTLLYGQILLSTLLSAVDKRLNKWLILITAFSLVLFSGIRYGVGIDFFSYFEYLQDVRLGNITYVEPGFLLLEKAVLAVGGREQLLFFTTAFLITYFTMKYIRYFSAMPILSCYLYMSMPIFYLASFNGIRQFLATALFAYSIRFLVERSLTRYLTVMTLAATFHVTAVLMIPLYFVMHKDLKIYHYLSIIMVYLLILPNISLLLSIMHMSEKYVSDYYVNEGVNLKSLILLPLFLVFSFYKAKLSKKCEGYNVFLNMIFFSILLSVTPLFSSIPSVLITRLTTYFTIALIILIPNAILAIKNLYIKQVCFIAALLFPAIYYWFTIISSGEGYQLVPYQFSVAFF